MNSIATGRWRPTGQNSVVIRLSLIATFLLAALLTAQGDESPLASVVAEAQAIHEEPAMRNGFVALAVIPISAPDANSLVGYQPDAGLLPASTLKVVTTATALDLLGPDYRFTTTLERTGTLRDDGVLEGDLVIRGGGDPSLGTAQLGDVFSAWREGIESAGINRIEGRIVGDGSLFGTQMRADSWQWNDLGNYYAAGACGLNVLRNQFYCRLKTGSPGMPAPLLWTNPKLPGVEIINEMRVGEAGSGDQGYVYGSPYTALLYLRGTVPAGGPHFTIRGALPDPAFTCARGFTQYLGKNGITVSGDPTTHRRLSIGKAEAGTRTTLLEHQSDPLSELVKVTNHRSDNLYAECIHRILGVEKGGGGSTAAAVQAVADHWKGKGIDLAGFTMADGCGLSRLNAVTARQLALILYHAAQGEHFAEFFASLPVAGKSGTLRSIGKGSPSEGRVHAKSGSLERVKAYCGYVDAASGERFAFALIFNNFAGESDRVKAKIVGIWNKIVTL